MKFLFINPPMDYDIVDKEYSFEAYMPPLGLLYLATPLIKKGYNVKVIDFVAEPFFEDKLFSEVSKYEIIGLTVTSQVANSVQKIVALIKKKFPDKKIIIGGPHCTIQKDESLNEIQADIAVIGDGELTILDIVDAFKGKKKLSNIHGIFYREKGKIFEGLPAKEIEDLDSIDFPSRDLVKHYNYGKTKITGVTFFAKGKLTTIMTTRGCPFNCGFCVSKSIFNKCRLRSAENVVEELVEISKNYDTVFAVDDNFLMDKKRANKIMDLLIEKQLDLDIWISGARVTDADKDLFIKMKKAGVKSIEFGIESGNQEVLDYYNKRITLNDVKKATSLSKKIGFLTIGNFILGAPIEKQKHVKDTISFAKKLNLDFAFFYGFNLLKGSPIWEDAYKAGKIEKNDMHIPCDTKNGLCNFSKQEIRNIRHRAFLSYYLSPKYIISQFIRSIFVYRHFRVFKAGLELLLIQKDETIFANR